MSSARDDILTRIRTALADHAPEVPIPRDYRRAGSVQLSDDQLASTLIDTLVDQFVDRLEDYRATVHRSAAGELAPTVHRILADRNVRRIVVPDGFPADELPEGVELVHEPVSIAELDDIGAVLTTCATAIAETGTIVLDAGPGQGARALTLVPDYHLVVVHIEQVVAIVPDAVAMLDPTRPLTWISGPSATSDIELKRVEGVHGPRTLDVVII